MADESGSIFDDVQFWSIVTQLSKRTVAVHPDHEDRFRSEVEIRGLEGLITVTSNPFVPLDRAFIFDTDAMDATLNEMLSKTITIKNTAENTQPPRSETE